MSFEIYKKYFDAHYDKILDELKAFLRIESISTDPSHTQACIECAQWLCRHVEEIGFTANIIETSGKPVILAERKVSDPAAKTLLFYGHYDVQPVDPRSMWITDPFDPEVRDGRVFARGAQDNKGQLFYVIKAIEALIKNNELQCNVKILIEGEEECGSGAIFEKLPELKGRLGADVLLVCDTGTPNEKIGCITMGLRGIAHFEVKLSGPKKVLHSGVHGGLVKNPATELCRLVALLHDKNGKVAVPGFYDDVEPISDEDRKLANSFNLEAERYRDQIGVLPLGGEKGIPPMERRGLRPTVELNGIYGGYQGEGSKTIIPSFAIAKFSLRLVANQDPERTLNMTLDYLKALAPKEMNFEILHAAPAGPALLLSSKSQVIQKVATILKTVTTLDPLYLWEGASIPLIPALRDASGAEPILVGFGLEEDNIHAPNESFALSQFEKGFLFSALFLKALSS